MSIAISQSTDTFVDYQGGRYKITADGEVSKYYIPPRNSPYWHRLKNSYSKHAMEIKRAAGAVKGNETESKASLRCGSYKVGVRG